MVAGYVELHAKSFYSFGEGASHTHELLAQAKEHAYASLALTDTNLCGALEFARLVGIATAVSCSALSESAHRS